VHCWIDRLQVKRFVTTRRTKCQGLSVSVPALLTSVAEARLRERGENAQVAQPGITNRGAAERQPVEAFAGFIYYGAVNVPQEATPGE
jgi:hypothetical protein